MMIANRTTDPTICGLLFLAKTVIENMPSVKERKKKRR